MGRIAIDYTTRQIIFYRFVCNDPEIINTYVGSTIDLVKRRCHHRSSCNNSTNKSYNLKVYEVIRDNGGFDAWKMIEIERRIVKDNQDAIRIEQQWIEFFHAQMNTRKAHITAEQVNEYNKQYKKQYYLEHTEHLKEQHKQYQLEHAEQIKEKNKQYNLEHAEQIKEYKKQYQLENAERIREQRKQYNLKHAERLKEQRRKRYLKKKAELNTTI